MEIFSFRSTANSSKNDHQSANLASGGAGLLGGNTSPTSSAKHSGPPSSTGNKTTGTSSKGTNSSSVRVLGLRRKGLSATSADEPARDTNCSSHSPNTNSRESSATNSGSTGTGPVASIPTHISHEHNYHPATGNIDTTLQGAKRGRAATLPPDVPSIISTPANSSSGIVAISAHPAAAYTASTVAPTETTLSTYSGGLNTLASSCLGHLVGYYGQTTGLAGQEAHNHRTDQNAAAAKVYDTLCNLRDEKASTQSSVTMTNKLGADSSTLGKSTITSNRHRPGSGGTTTVAIRDDEAAVGATVGGGDGEDQHTAAGNSTIEGSTVAGASHQSDGAISFSQMTGQTTFFHRTSKSKPALRPGGSLRLALRERVPECSTFVETGIPVMKVCSNGTIKPRVLTISKDKFTLFISYEAFKGGKGVDSLAANKLGALPIQSTRRQIVFRNRSPKYIDIADIDAVFTKFVGTRKLEYARESPRLKGIDSLVDRKSDEIVSIFHHGMSESLDVLVLNEEHRQELVMALDGMMRTYADTKRLMGNDALMMRYYWYDVDVNRDSKVNESEFPKVLNIVNLHLKHPKKVFRDYRKQVLGRNSGGMTYAEVVSLLQSLKDTCGCPEGRSMPNMIWDEVFGKDKDEVGATEFMTNFCHATQGDKTTSLQDVKNILLSLNEMELNHREGEPTDVDSGEITRERFEAYLYHEMNSAYDPSTLNQRELLNDSISRYWINTSHNTYLTGDQLTSNSSVEMYLRALCRGCKCLELDCWDGETTEHGPLPVVYHGYTVTSKILFADIIRVVRAYMDENPQTYPIILSLENHCTPPHQRTIAFILEDVLGSYLYIPTNEDKAEDSGGELPSPEQLRGRVVIKGKRPPEADEQNSEDDEKGIVANDNEGIQKDDRSESKSKGIESKPSTESSPTTSSHKSTTVQELARLTLLHGTKYKAFETSIIEPVSHMHSIGETKINKILGSTRNDTAAQMWRLYNLNHMTRTYPAGARVDSSNYNPVLAWSLGCQLVALNFQTYDSPMIINDGKFREKCSSGYLRKPDGLLEAAYATAHGNQTMPKAQSDEGSVVTSTASVNNPEASNKSDGGGGERIEVIDGTQGDLLDTVMDSFEEVACGEDTTKVLQSKQRADALRLCNSPINSAKAQDAKQDMMKTHFLRLIIRVLSGSCLPKPKGEKDGEMIDPYVTITLHDVVKGSDGTLAHSSKSLSTDCIDNNGFCPVWNQPDDTQFIVHCPQVAMITFELHDEDLGFDDKIASAAIPVNSLRKGYRSVQLFNSNNTRSGPFGFANLLVEVRIFTESE